MGSTWVRIFHVVGHLGFSAKSAGRALAHGRVLALELGIKFGADEDDHRGIHIHIMRPIAAPSVPYVLLKLPKLAAYHENNAEAASHSSAAVALPQVIQRHLACCRSGPN